MRAALLLLITAECAFAAPLPSVFQLSLSDQRTLTEWQGPPVGNVAIMTPEGKHLQLTKTATAQQPKSSKNGLVGWVDCSKFGDPAVLNLAKRVPIGSRLILRKPDASLLTITSVKPIIEQWGFDPDGIHVVLKSRALHGPAIIERFTIKERSKNGAYPAYDSTAPAWAKPYLDH